MFIKKKYPLLIAAVLLVTILSSSISISQVWKKVPGTLEYVNFLKFSIHDNNKLYVGSDAIPTDMTTNNITFPFFGYGYQVSTNSGATYSESKLSDYSIFDIIESPDNPLVLLVSARKQDVGRVFYSEDGGAVWDEETKRCESSGQVSKFEANKVGDKINYYASMLNSTNGFSYSSDNFITCNTVEGIKMNSRDIALSSVNPSVIYLAGDNVSKSRVICSTDGGLTWEDRSEGLMNYRVLSIVTSPINEAVVIVGADSTTPTGRIIGMGIYYSDDYGKSWRYVGAAGASVYDIQFHPSNPKYCAAAGGLAGVFISGTGGDYWEASTAGLPNEMLVRKVAVPNIQPNQNGIIVYASIYGDGIYKSDNITTSINSNDEFQKNQLVKQIYPMPADDVLGFILNDASLTFNYEIYDLMGKIVQNGLISGNSLLNIQELNMGTYFIKISHSGNYQLLKFNKI